MALVRNRTVVDDAYTDVGGRESIPTTGAVIVDLEQWQANRDTLSQRSDPIGVRLSSEQAPELITDDLESLALIALEFPAFRDGRAYSYARLLRDKYGFTGEVRAVGEVLLEQLHFMERTGFDTFEIDSDDPLRDLEIAAADFSVWYQPSADGRTTAIDLRHRRD